MSRTPPAASAPPPDEHVTVVCAAMYVDDLRGQYAFNFAVPATNTRFTIYTRHPDRYHIAATYALILAAPDAVPVPLIVEEVALLRGCLTDTMQRWRAAIAEAGAGAERLPREQLSEPGHLDVEPTPAGYRSVGRLLRDQLARAEQLDAQLGEVLAATQTEEGGS
jgi:hypothetical protein